MNSCFVASALGEGERNTPKCSFCLTLLFYFFKHNWPAKKINESRQAIHYTLQGFNKTLSNNTTISYSSWKTCGAHWWLRSSYIIIIYFFFLSYQIYKLYIHLNKHTCRQWQNPVTCNLPEHYICFFQMSPVTVFSNTFQQVYKAHSSEAWRYCLLAIIVSHFTTYNVCGFRFGMCVPDQRWTHSLGGRILHGPRWHRGYRTGVMPWRCQLGPSSCREGLTPPGVTYGSKSSDTKRHQGGSCAPVPTDLHVTFAVHPIASNG